MDEKFGNIPTFFRLLGTATALGLFYLTVRSWHEAGWVSQNPRTFTQQFVSHLPAFWQLPIIMASNLVLTLVFALACLVILWYLLFYLRKRGLEVLDSARTDNGSKYATTACICCAVFFVMGLAIGHETIQEMKGTHISVPIAPLFILLSFAGWNVAYIFMLPIVVAC